jgi:DNA gyrase subunit A
MSEEILKVPIEEEAKQSYLDYAMSVIIGRAIPDVRDGLKPVQRRILYGMYEIGLLPNKPYKKSARVVGHILSFYHPHGDQAVYDTLVRMAQPFTMRYPLVDGQGNFGSIDGDPAAAMRYCVVGDTLILTDRGLIPIEEIVPNSQPNSDSDVDLKVVSIDRKIHRADKFFNSGTHPVLKITTDLGLEIEGTFNHPVLVWKTDSQGKPHFEWKLLEQVEEGDYLVVLLNTRFFPEEENLFEEHLSGVGFKSSTLAVALDLKTELLRVLKTSEKIQIEFFKKLITELGEEAENAFVEFPDEKSAQITQVALLNLGVLTRREENKLLFNSKKEEVLKELENAASRSWSYVKTKVLRKEFTGLKTVYSVRVKSECHSFVANGIINHNTEARLTPLAVEMLEDIEKDTVDWQPNFDGSVNEPKVLPSKFPNLLCNGTTGIAVGLATSIPPHNLKEVAKALIAVAENPDITVEEIVEKYIKAPDFPTGAIIENTKEELIEIYKTGKGSIHLKAKIHVEKQKGGKELIVITELPYQVNKAELIKRIAQLARDKKIKNITDLRDESDKEGIRIVIEVSRYGEPEKIIKQLLRYTQLRKNFPVNMVVLVDGEPRQLGLKDLLQQFVKHRIEVITRRTKYFLRKAERRLHIVEGLLKAVKDIDRVIEIVRGSQTADEAKTKLVEEFELTPTQAQAVLDLRLQRLTSLETKALEEEAEKLRAQIEDYKNILLKQARKIDIFKKELQELVKKYGDERRSFVEYLQGEFSKGLVPVAVFKDGTVQPLEDENEREFDKPVVGLLKVSLKEGLFIATNLGRTYWITGDKLLKTTKVKLKEGEKIIGVFRKEFGRLLIATKKGYVKKLSLEDFNYTRAGSPIIKLTEGDEVVGIWEAQDWGDIVLYTVKGKVLRFPTNKVNTTGPSAKGSVGIKLDKGDEVSGICAVHEEPYLIFITAKGKVKKVKTDAVPVKNKGTKPLEGGIIRDKLVKIIPTDKDLVVAINFVGNGGTVAEIKLNELKEQRLDGFPKSYFNFEKEIESVYNDWIHYKEVEESAAEAQV